MPFTDNFANDYLWFQEDTTLALDVVQDGTGGTREVNSNGFDPRNSTPITIRPLVAIPFQVNGGAAPSTTLDGLYNGGSVREVFGKAVCSYSLSFDPWLLTDQTQSHLMTFSSIVFTNTTTSDILFNGVELVDAGQETTDAGFPSQAQQNTFVLTRENETVNTYPVYSCTETFTFTKGHRLVDSTTNVSARIHQIHDSSGVKRFIPAVAFDSAQNPGETVAVHNIGRFSVARFNFPSVITLAGGDSIAIALGSLEVIYDAEVIT